MSLSGISAGYSGVSTESLFQKIQEEFQQLGKDLQSGNLTAAQADYVTLQEDMAERDAASSIQAQAQAQTQTQAPTQSSDPIATAFSQLSQDLQSGNLTAAQTDYATIVQDFSQAGGVASQSGTPTPGGTSSQSGNPIAQEFQQLGKDLRAGNLTAAQADFATLQQDFSQGSTAWSTQSTSPIAAAFSQLSQDLQSGNLTAAQQDFATIQQDFQAQAAQAGQGAEGHHHHHHGGDSSSGSSEASSKGSGEIGKLMTELGTELQSGNLSSAQATYTSLEQDFQQFSQSGRKVAGTAIQSSGSALSVSA